MCRQLSRCIFYSWFRAENWWTTNKICLDYRHQNRFPYFKKWNIWYWLVMELSCWLEWRSAAIKDHIFKRIFIKIMFNMWLQNKQLNILSVNSSGRQENAFQKEKKPLLLSCCVLLFLEAAERGDVPQSDICASFTSLPASLGCLPALQLERAFHTGPAALLCSAFCSNSRALCWKPEPFSPTSLRKGQCLCVGDICWEVAWVHVVDRVIFAIQNLLNSTKTTI